MSSSSRFPTHHVPDDGIRYAPGEAVSIDQSSGRIQVVKDPMGDYEIVSCRPATEYGGDPPLLRLGLRERVSVVAEEPAPTWSEGPTRVTPFGGRRIG
jgi:hypothetical protein